LRIITAAGEAPQIELPQEHQQMKKIPGMKSRISASGLAAIVLGSALLAAVASANDATVLRTAGGVSYVSGGVGADSIDRLNSLARDFNLKLVFALKSGSYVSDVGVVIADAAGKTVLATTSEGPWLLTRLPAGNYQIVATFAGNTVTRQVAVGAAALTTLDFRWATE
jgi:hypothetical protein